jgi:osmotically-inducible protein OsmY
MKRATFLTICLGGGLWAQKAANDGAISDQVRVRLANDPDIKGGSLDVDVQAGVVTVKGRVATDKARLKVDKIVKKVKGVTQVVNQVKVEP